MMGMGSDKGIGAILLKMGPAKEKEKEVEVSKEDMLDLCGKRLIECAKEGDAMGLMMELKKAINLLQGMDEEYDD